MFWRTAAIATGMALLVAACSDDDGDAASSPEATATEATATEATAPELDGEPIELMWIGPLTGEVVMPEALAGARAAAAAINAAGGIQGRPVEISECDEQQDPAENERCAQELVESDALATVGQFTRGGTAVVAAESANSIAAIGIIPVQADDPLATSTATFAFNAPDRGILACAAALYEGGVRNIATMVLNVDAARALSAGTQAVISQLEGATFTGEIATEVSDQDFAGDVQAALDQGAEGVVIAYPEAFAVSLLQANAGRLEVCFGDGGISGANLVDLGDAADGFRVQTALPTINQLEDLPLGRQFLEEMATYYEESGDEGADPENIKSNTLNAWMSVYAFQQVASDLPELTRESVFEAFTNETSLAFEGLLAEPVDFTQFQVIPQLARIFNPRYRSHTWDAAAQEFVPAGDTVYDIIDLIVGGS